MSHDSRISRRDLIAMFGAAGLSSRLPEVQPREPLVYWSASAMAKAVKAKQVSSTELVTACLKQIDKVNPAINAVVMFARARALMEAAAADAKLARKETLGPLHGVPMTIKDSFDTAGVISTAGTLGRKNYVPQKDATAVARLRRAGAILLGKTNTPEITAGEETFNAVYGRTNNPYDLRRTPGGSSGGPAAIVAAAGSPFDIGSDTTDSIRAPAHFCGITGLKPSAGRVPRTGHIISFASGAMDSWTQIGPLARHVEDLELVLHVIAGPDYQDPAISDVPLGPSNRIILKKLRIAFHVDNGIRACTPETIQAVRAAAMALGPAVLQMEERRPPGIERTAEVADAVIDSAFDRLAARVLAKAGNRGAYLPQGGSAAQLDNALIQLDLFRSEMLGFLENHDIILCPANAVPALPHGQQSEGEHNLDFTYMTTYAMTGWPVCVVRAGTSPGGLPIGIQVVGRPWREDVVLAVAAFLEKQLGGWKPPAIARS
ncbi:MAG TPA: amidase [Terriglobia bacterium]|jgi:amidase